MAIQILLQESQGIKKRPQRFRWTF